MQLRFQKVAELIHNSTFHRNLERACVTVHFQEIIDRVRVVGVCADPVLCCITLWGGWGVC
jgi:hypothetical protein